MMGVRVIQYSEKPDSHLYVQMTKKGVVAGEPAFVSSGKEQMTEAIPGIYTLCVRLLAGDTTDFVIVNREGDYLYSGMLLQTSCEAELEQSRYGKICGMSEKTTDSKVQYSYAELSDLTDILFIPIEE